jgi:hypothetical protein
MQVKSLWNRIVAKKTKDHDAKKIRDFEKHCKGTGGGRPATPPEGNSISFKKSWATSRCFKV